MVTLIGVNACSSFHRGTSDPIAFTTWATTAHYPPVVAIPPFTNKTNQPDLTELVRVGFSGHLSPLPFNDRELGDIDRILELLKKNQKNFFSGAFH